MKRKLLAILLSLAMLFTLLPPGAALAVSPSYVALGDSITTGYGLAEEETAFPTTVANNVGATLTNLAADGETSASLLTKLQTDESVKTAVSDADVITITIGGNDLMDALYEYLATRYNMDETDETNTDKNMSAEDVKAALTAETPDIILLMKFIGYIPDFDSEQIEVALQNYASNLNGIVTKINELNQNVVIVVATQYNPYKQIDTSNKIFGPTIKNVVDAFENGVNALNTKIKAENDSYAVADVKAMFDNPGTTEPLCNASIVINGDVINGVTIEELNLDFHPNANGHEVIAVVVGNAMKIVTGVTVSPQQIVLAPGETEKFSAEVSGAVNGINVDQAVTWAVTDNISSETKIENGELTIGKNETAETLTVTATSKVDDTKSGTAIVTVGEKAEIYVGGVGLNSTSDTPAYATTDTDGKVTTSGASEDNYNIKWDGTTLTLKDATIKTARQISKDAGMTAIYREASLDIVLQGANTVVSPAMGSKMSTGIYAGPADTQTATPSYGITISGDGSLDVSGSDAEDSSFGIGAMMGDITIESGRVIARGGATNDGNSAGIMTSTGDVIIHNGTVTATSGAAGVASAGIYAMMGDVIISGGTVTATGGAANVASAGIFAHGFQEDAINMGGNVTISGGEVTAIAENGSGITVMKTSPSGIEPGNVTISPANGQQIAVKTGDAAESATAIDGSPFTVATQIQDSIQNAAYVHTVAEPAPVTEYTITFDANGGSVDPASAETTDGKLVSLPTPGYAGHIFQGWFTAATGGTQVTTDTVFTADATIYAQWKAESSTPSTPTGPSKPVEPDGPATEDSEGWSAIEDELAAADDGDDIAVDMNGATEVPKEIFESVAGKSVEVSFDLEGGLSWTVNGAGIPTDADLSDLDLGVTMDSDGIPVDVIDAVTSESSTTVQMTLAHDGEFGFTMTLSAPLGKENAGLWANLYHYDEDAEAMTFETATLIDDDGNVALPMRHASQYAIVIDDHSHAAEAALPFSDVNADDWFFDVVRYVYEQGLMTGTSDTEFSPNLTTTRGMIVSILTRLEDGPTAEAAGFTDVADGDWYAEAVNWAAREGIVAGYEDNTFRPNDPITREQLAAMLMNYAAWKGEDVSARADLSGYNDAASVSSWAAETVQWAVAEGLISGMPGNLLEPQGSATRAQVAAILQRFLSD